MCIRYLWCTHRFCVWTLVLSPRYVILYMQMFQNLGKKKMKSKVLPVWNISGKNYSAFVHYLHVCSFCLPFLTSSYSPGKIPTQLSFNFSCMLSFDWRLSVGGEKPTARLLSFIFKYLTPSGFLMLPGDQMTWPCSFQPATLLDHFFMLSLFVFKP